MGTVIYLVFIAVASFAVLAWPAVAQGADTTLPLTYPAQVLQGDGSQTCASEEQREILRNEIRNATHSLLDESVVPILQPCGGPGWRRVANLNMSDPSQQCPSVWKEITTPFWVCGKFSTSPSCEGVTYPTGSEQYDQVCGRIIGYQLGSTDAFAFTRRSVDSYYMDGISVTHGPPAIISGALLVVLMKLLLTMFQHAPASLGAPLELAFPHLWARTTSVKQA